MAPTKKKTNQASKSTTSKAARGLPIQKCMSLKLFFVYIERMEFSCQILYKSLYIKYFHFIQNDSLFDQFRFLHR